MQGARYNQGRQLEAPCRELFWFSGCLFLKDAACKGELKAAMQHRCRVVQ